MIRPDETGFRTRVYDQGERAIAKRTVDLPSVETQRPIEKSIHAPAGESPQSLHETVLLTSHRPQAPSSIAELTTRIVCTYLEKPDVRVDTLADLMALIQSTFLALLDYEMQRYERTNKLLGATSRGPEASPAPGPVPGPHLDVGELGAASGDSEAPGGKSLIEGDESKPGSGRKIRLPDAHRLRDERRANRPSSHPVDEQQPDDFDCEKWLSSFSNPSAAMIAEARSDNPNNRRGWIGVYDDRIVCLLTGRSLKILGAHLRRLFKNDPDFGSFATHAGYVEGLKLPIDYPKAAPYLSTIRTDVAARRGKGGATRPAALQQKIDKVLAATSFDLSLREKPATRPGNFPDFIVCLECGEAMHDIRPHLRERHNTFYDRYKRDWQISGRAPATGEGGMSFTDTRKHAAQLLESMNIAPSKQVVPDRWPGVLEEKILCLIDGNLVDNLPVHLASTGLPPVAHYLARYELPADYPSVPPSVPPARDTTGAQTGGSAKRKRESRAKASRHGVNPPKAAAANNDVSAPITLNQEASKPEAASVDNLGVTSLADRLQKELEAFKQSRVAANVEVAAGASSALTRTGRKTIETRVIESKSGAQPVTVERRPRKLYLRK